MSDETFIIRDVVLPLIPEDIPESLKEYLIELEAVLTKDLRGSMYINKVLEDGYIGN